MTKLLIPDNSLVGQWSKRAGICVGACCRGYWEKGLEPPRPLRALEAAPSVFLWVWSRVSVLGLEEEWAECSLLHSLAQ